VLPAVAAASVARGSFGRIPRPYDLEDLLRASSEVLGKGTYSTTYKAVMESEPVMAVKHLRRPCCRSASFGTRSRRSAGSTTPTLCP
jgi:hypothetical protein